MLTGLCASCVHHRWIVSGRGSRFLFCDYSKHNSAWAKYPPLPVFECAVHRFSDGGEKGANSDDSPAGDAGDKEKP